MRAIIVFLVIGSTAAASPLPDDAAISRRLVGTWHDYRHDTRYFDDGTYLVDPADRPPTDRSGKWRIKHGKLIEKWRFEGVSRDSTVVQQLIQLDRHVLKFRTLSQSGPGRPESLVLPSGVYTLTRIR
jgi:hypothetical protein